jgi:hypothetical protein
MAPDARSISGPMLAWAKTTMAKPIAVAANAKPIFRFMGEPSFKFNQNPTPSLAAKSVMAITERPFLVTVLTKRPGKCDGRHEENDFRDGHHIMLAGSESGMQTWG